MKTKELILVVMTLVCIRFTLSAQLFEPVDSIKVFTNQAIKGIWADLNNDGQLDYLLFSITHDHKVIPLILTIDNDKLVSDTLQIDEYQEANFLVDDINNDNKLDIIFTGKLHNVYSLRIFENEGDFSFRQDTIMIDSIYADQIVSVDLNRNGRKDIIINGLDENKNPIVKIFENKVDGWHELESDFEGLLQGKLIAFDYNNDGYQDILINGLGADQNPVIHLWENGGDYKFEKKNHPFEGLVSGDVSFGDLDSNGFFDLIFTGLNNQGLAITNLYLNNQGQFEYESISVDSIYNSQLFIADLNSDGNCDFVLKGEDGLKGINSVMLNDGNGNFNPGEIPNSSSSYQSFGDYDNDGDLDLIQAISNSDSMKIILLENITGEKNLGPAVPTNPIAIQGKNSVYIKWTPGIDDHTDTLAITFDMFIGKNDWDGSALSPGFDLNNLYRTKVAHGNQGVLPFAAYHEFEPGIYSYGIQSEDNALYAGGGNGGICRGKFVICAEPNITSIVTCKDEIVELAHNEGFSGEWYSVVNGFLGQHDKLQLTVFESDTIYFGIPNSVDCNEYQGWTIEVIDDYQGNILVDKWGCEGEELKFEVEGFWQTINWSSKNKGSLSNTKDLNYILDTMTLSLLRVYRNPVVFLKMRLRLISVILNWF